MPGLKKLIEKTRSSRRFDEKVKITRRKLLSLVDLARLSPCARNQQALKFKLSYDREKNNRIFPALAWAGALKDWKGPEEGERPSAYIIILGDTRVSSDFGPDHGIAAHSILLGASEMGLGGCMIGMIDRNLLRRNLGIPARYKILLVVALGKPSEQVALEELKKGQSTDYYRDENGVHHVPKRKMEDLII